MAATLLFAGSLWAEEESDATTQCDQTYDKCLEKCDQNADGSETCYTACDEAYDKCLVEAQK